MAVGLGLFGHVQLCATECGRRPLVAGYTRDGERRVSAGRHQLSTPLMRLLAISSSSSMQFA
jgi:hypothetical protein